MEAFYNIVVEAQVKTRTFFLSYKDIDQQDRTKACFIFEW